MADKLLSLDQVLNLVSPETVASGEFPRPVRLPFCNITYWLKSDVQKWLQTTLDLSTPAVSS